MTSKRSEELNLSDFKKILYVGEAIEADLLGLGYTDVASLKGAIRTRCLSAQKRSDAAAIGVSSMFTVWFATM